MIEKVKQFWPYVILVLLLIAIPVTVMLVRQRQEIRSKAASGGDVSLFFVPDTSNIYVGNSFPVDLKINSGANLSVSGIDVTVNFDKTKLAIEKFEVKAPFDTQIIPTETDTGINSETGTLHFIAVDQTERRITGITTVGTITFKALDEGEAEISIAKVQMTASGKETALIVDKGQGIYTLQKRPQLSSVYCSYDPQGLGTIFAVSGWNLGSRTASSKVEIGGKEAQIISWNDQPFVPTPTASASASPSATPSPATTSGTLSFDMKYSPNTSAVLAASISQTSIVAKTPDKIDGTAPIKISLGNLDLITTCTIGLTTADFDINTECRQGDFTESNVDVIIVEDIAGAKPISQQKINFDKDGKPTGFNPQLEKGKKYVLFIKSPKSITQVARFTAEEGTTNLSSIILPVGDIYGQGGKPDNIINAVDKAELAREWSLTTDVSRPGDFNGDSRVNSVDYACMRENIGKSGAILPR